MKITKEQTFYVRKFLKSEFEQRLQKNKAYSLRAFSRKLGIDPGTLSRIISGKQAITANRFNQIADNLNLHPEELKQKIDKTRRKSSKLKSIKLDQFRIASNWYHDAILELTHLEQFNPCPKWIAKQLELPLNIVKMAIERLVESKQLLIDPDGCWKDISPHSELALLGDYTDLSLRNYQKQMLEISYRSIDKFDRKKRNHTSTISSIDENIIPEVNKMIQDFHKKLINYIEVNSKKKNHTQAFQFSSFPVLSSQSRESI